MPRRLWAVLLLAPFALVAMGTQIAAVTGLAGVVQSAWGARDRNSADVLRGVATVERAAQILAATWASPAAWLLEHNPITLGAVDDVRGATTALAASAKALTPLAQMGTEVVGFDGNPPMVRGTTVDTSRIADLGDQVADLHDSLAAALEATSRVPGSGLLGRPIGAIADSAAGALADLTQLSAAAEIAWPDLPEAFGAAGPRRYLVCALNDAESFGSGGAPLSALLVQAVRGTVSVPISGQLESKLSPDNPPISWDHVGGPPWYRDGRTYPFVNSNFHPDFRTASVDMRRAWAALGYPEVQGVITIDVSALATLLAWAGPVQSAGFGEVTSDNLVRKVLVDAYRDFNSPEGVVERHARNDELSTSIGSHLTAPLNLMPAIRGTMDSIPPRHIQASFDAPDLQRAAELIGADGAVSADRGDLVGVFSQSGPNKLTVFQERSVTHRVQLLSDGGAIVRQTIRFTNAVPPDIEGDPTTYRGYTALLARLRVAYRIPSSASDLHLSTGTSIPLVPEARQGPYSDGRGGQVLWQGHDTPPGASTTVELRYRLPAGTFPKGTYQVAVDPQALPLPVELTVIVTAAPGSELSVSPGWRRSKDELIWSGTLDRALHLEVGL